MPLKFKPKRLQHPILSAYKWLVWMLHFVINWIKTSGDLFGVFYCKMCEILMKVIARFGMRFNTSRVISISPFCHASICGFRTFLMTAQICMSKLFNSHSSTSLWHTPQITPSRQCKLRRIKIHDAQNFAPSGVFNECAIKYQMHN